MGEITDELLFYGGIGLAAAGLILLFLYAGISQIAKRNLKKQLEKEYGEKPAN